MPRLIRGPEVQRRTGLSRTTIWRRERRGEFPQRVQIGRNSVAWVEAEVDRWVQERAEGHRVELKAPANQCGVPS